MNDQPVAEAATYTTQSKHERRTSVPSAGFETAVPVMERLQTYALDCTATGIGSTNRLYFKFILLIQWSS
jgi:hypothetical protein